MILTFFSLHAKQAFRFLLELGVVRGIILLFIIFCAISATSQVVLENTYILYALPFVLIFSLHTVRSDKDFLKVLGIDTYLLFLVEYHLVAAPFYAALLWQGMWMEALGLLIVVNVVPLLRFKISYKAMAPAKLSIMPTEAFEWRSGLRRNGIFLLVIYLLALIFYQYPFIALVAIVIFTFITTSFYNEAESRAMIEAFGKPARQYIMMKWKNQLMIFWIACLPLMIIYLFRNIEYWYVLPVLIMISSIIQILSINLKYAFYEPGKTVDKSIFVMIYSMSLFVPFFVPVPLIMMIRYYNKAVKNLSYYVHD